MGLPPAASPPLIKGLVALMAPGHVVDPFPAPFPLAERNRAVDGIPYGGIHRLPWAHIASAWYHARLALPERIQQLYGSLRQSTGITGLELCRCLDDATEMLTWCLSKLPNYELTAVRYEHPVVHAPDDWPVPASVDWTGFDVVEVGEASLLLDGLFARPELFGGLRSALNNRGLLAERQSAERLISQYRQAARAGLLPELSADYHGVEPIVMELGLVRSYGLDDGNGA